MDSINFTERSNFIWSIANLLRGPYRPNQYKDVMLPLVVLRRLDCVLEPTKQKVLKAYETMKGKKADNEGVIDLRLRKITGLDFFNSSPYDFQKLKDDADNIAANFVHYIQGFSAKLRSIVASFKFEEQLEKLQRHNLLLLVISKFAETDLHPEKVSNIEMGYVFEDLIRRFNAASNEEAGDHFTPREVIRLMVEILFKSDREILEQRGSLRRLYDPAMGTGGMLSISEEYLHEQNLHARLKVFGQDYNEQSYAVSGSDMLIKGQNIENIVLGDSLTEDGFVNASFDYMLANPPFGVEWKSQEEFVKDEHEKRGYDGRFGAGLPRITDGSFLFLQHMISKMKKPEDGGTRLAIVFNGSPLFTGSAGSGESEIRKWIIEQDLLEGIIALPDQLFYNTGIATYIWVLSNRKTKARKGKIQLIDATSYFSKMRKSLGNKRHEISEEGRKKIAALYENFKETKHCKIFENADFGYARICVEQPLRVRCVVDEAGLARLQECTQFAALGTSKKRKNSAQIEAEIAAGKKQQDAIVHALREINGVFYNYSEFVKALEAAFARHELVVSATLRKACVEAFSQRDEKAEVAKDERGRVKAVPELRDYVNVPLKEAVAGYMAREVLPYVSEAWVDESKTKVGYEISFNRYFYEYQAPRSLEEIEGDLRKVESEIARFLQDGMVHET